MWEVGCETNLFDRFAWHFANVLECDRILREETAYEGRKYEYQPCSFGEIIFCRLGERLCAVDSERRGCQTYREQRRSVSSQSVALDWEDLEPHRY